MSQAINVVGSQHPPPVNLVKSCVVFVVVVVVVAVVAVVVVVVVVDVVVTLH